MKFEGTKGEWKANIPEHTNPTVKANGSKICDVLLKSRNINEPTANARLISAAPELLDAVLITLKWIKTGQEPETAVRNRCEKALKKALAKKDADLEEWFTQIP